MRRIPRKSTFALIAAFTLFAAFLPLLAALPALLTTAKTQSDDRMNDVLQTAARQVSNQLRSELSQRWRAHEALVQLAASGVTGTALGARLDTAQLLDPSIAWAGLAAPDGRILISTGSVLQGRDVSARPWFRAGLQGHFAGDMHPPALLAQYLRPAPDNEPTRLIDFASPVRRADGTTMGVLGTHLDVSWLRRLMREALAMDQAQLMLVARDGIVLAGPPAMQGQRLGARALLSAQQGVPATSTDTSEDGASYVTVAVPIEAANGMPSFGWSVVVRQSPSAMVAITRRLGMTVGVPLLLSSVTVLVIGVLLARAVTRPLRRLALAATALAEGRTDAPIAEARTSWEMSAIADALARLDRQVPTNVVMLRDAA